MPLNGRWLPREGFSFDVLQSLVEKTVLNPALSLPLFILSRYTRKGQSFTYGHEKAVQNLKVFVYLGLARWLNGVLNRGVLDNWKSDKWDWSKDFVVITGGSDGIGKHIVLLLAAKNIKVVILDIQEPTYDLPNPNIHYHHCDLTSPTSISTAASTIISTYGHPAVLLNNAGLANSLTILSTPDSALERIFALNILSHFRLTKAFLPHMIARNHGMIVTIASLAAFVTPPQLVDYACTKAAALAFHEGLAQELKNRHHAPKVRTLCICPSWVNTKLSQGYTSKSSWLSRTLEPETVAEVVVGRILKGNSGVVVLPRVHEWLGSMIRGRAEWVQVILRDGTKDAVMTGMGRGSPVDEEAVSGEKEGEISAREAEEKAKEGQLIGSVH